MEKLDELKAIAALFESQEVNPMPVYPEDILDIAEAFRALEQRAEAAEAKLAGMEKQEARKVFTCTGCGHAVLDEHPSVCDCMETGAHWSGSDLFTRPAPASDHVSVQEAWEACGGNPGIKATREELLEVLRLMDEAEDEEQAASPAADLYYLVPGERSYKDIDCDLSDFGKAISAQGWNDCRAAIMRNIEAVRSLSSGAEWFREQYLLKITPTEKHE